MSQQNQNQQRNGNNKVSKRIQFEKGFIDLRFRGGELTSYQATVPLLRDAGEIEIIQSKPTVTVIGYTKLNKVASLNVINAPHLYVDGKEVNNPYVERNPVTRAIESVAIRKLCIGFSPVGNWVVIDKTVFLNIYTYFLQSLFAKVKDAKGENAPGIPVGVPVYCPLAPDAKIETLPGTNDICAINEDNKKVYIFKQIEPGSGMWIDVSHREIIDAYKEHIQRQKFGDRLADSIATRNVLKTHPAIGIQQVTLADNNTAWVTVYGWRHESGKKEIEAIAKKVWNNETGDDVEVVQSTDIADMEEVEIAETEEVAGREEAEFNTPNGSENGNGNSVDPGNGKQTLFDTADDAIRDQIKNAAKIKGVDIDEFVRKEFKVAELSVLKGKSLDQCLEKLKG